MDPGSRLGTFVLLLLGCMAPAAATRHGRWLLIEVRDAGSEIVSQRLLDHPHAVDYRELGRLHRGAHDHEQGSVSVYYHSQGRTAHRLTRPNPRLIISEGLGGRGLRGAARRQDTGVFAVTVPADASHVTVEQHPPPGARAGAGARATRTVHARAAPAKFAALGTAGAVAGNVSFVGDPAKHVNVVLLAAGFRAGERAKFDAVVAHAVKFLQGSVPLGMMPVPVLPSPWDRYMPLVNVYSVFQPSADSGASFPKDAYGNGGHPGTSQVGMHCNGRGLGGRSGGG